MTLGQEGASVEGAQRSVDPQLDMGETKAAHKDMQDIFLGRHHAEPIVW